jgi:NIMA (never in mitosis gene a)-related kinase
MATLKHAFNAKDINALVFKILKGKVSKNRIKINKLKLNQKFSQMPPMPNMYSKELIVLIESMLNADPKKRPSVNKILRDAYIRQNINSFLERTKAK